MKNINQILILVIIAALAFFGWKKYKGKMGILSPLDKAAYKHYNKKFIWLVRENKKPNTTNEWVLDLRRKANLNNLTFEEQTALDMQYLCDHNKEFSGAQIYDLLLNNYKNEN